MIVMQLLNSGTMNPPRPKIVAEGEGVPVEAGTPEVPDEIFTTQVSMVAPTIDPMSPERFINR